MTALHPTMHRRPRGYALLLVLALLSILLILATTLSYTSRLELAATENFARGVQGRFAALSGLPVSAALFAAEGDRTHFLQPWAFGAGLGPNEQLNSSLPAAQAQVVLASTLPIGEQSGHLVQAFQGRIGSGSAAGLMTDRDGTPGQPSDAPAALPMPSHEVNVPGYGMARLRIQDESGKLNINRAGTLSEDPERAVAESPATLNLQAFVAAALDEAGLDPNLAPAVARSIVLYRLGPDSEPGEAGVDDDSDSVDENLLPLDGLLDPEDWRRQEDGPGWNAMERRGGEGSGRLPPELDGIDNDADGVIDEPREGIDEPDEQIADPRLAPRGDDRIFLRPDDLMRIPIITPDIYAALAPHLTVHSASETRARGEGGAALVDINRADFETILEQLERHFPERSRDLLRQFALNVIDSRDADRVPTEDATSGLLGLERVPLINEIWPDSETAANAGDDGQFVEIINPWNTEIDLAGMHLSVGGQRTALDGVLEPGALLIVTDDFDEGGDDDPEDDIPNYGSFVEIFNLHPNGTQRRLIVDPLLDLPDHAGTVELIDEAGNVLDRFSWSAAVQASGLRTSFQRDDPRVRSVERRLCTPWARNANTDIPAGHLSTHAESIPLDRPFSTPSDLMFVFAGWADAAEPARRGWRFPEIHSDEHDTLDSRLVDIFSVGPLEAIPAEEDEEETEADDPDALLAEEESAGEESDDEEGPVIEGREWAIGRININTASWPVLMALPGMTEDLADAILNWRAQVELMWHSDPTVREAPFTHRGDLLRNDFVWQGVSERDRLLRFRQMANALTTSSATLRMEATAATEPGRRTPATAPRTIRAELEVRDGATEVVRLEFWEGL